MRAHASFAYPSHLPPLLDVALLLLVAGLFLWREGWVTAACSRIDAFLAALAAGGGARALARLALLAVMLHGVGLLLVGAPRPWVTDEYAYLLGAQTFAAGRMTNPLPVIDPESDEHLEEAHVLTAPTRQSKYPPGQSLWLAPGALLGRPWLTLPLLSGVLAAAIGWCLLGALPPPAAALGTLAATLWVGVGSYWGHSYWGGSLGAAAGALVLGSALRLHRRPTMLRGVALGGGAALLAVTRPWEGFAYCLPFLVVLAIWLLRSRRRREWLPAIAAAAAVLVVALALLGAYHRAVTGDPLLLPHLLYTDQDDPGHHHFVWSDPGGDPSEVASVPTLLVGRASTAAWFLLGAPLCFALLAGLGFRSRERDADDGGSGAGRSGPKAVPLLAAGAVLVAQALVVPWHPHYPGPALAALLLLALLGVERMGETRFLGRRWRPALVVAILLCSLAGAAARLPAHRHDPGSETWFRADVEARLGGDGRQHVVFVPLPAPSDGSWVHNPPEPLAQRVLWVRSLGAERDRRLLSRLQRVPWRIDFEADRQRLLPYLRSGEGQEAP